MERLLTDPDRSSLSWGIFGDNSPKPGDWDGSLVNLYDFQFGHLRRKFQNVVQTILFMHNLSIPEFLSAFYHSISSTSRPQPEGESTEKRNPDDPDRSENNILKSGRWSYDEQVLYIEFAERNKAHLETKECRRSSRIFKMMAAQIKTRGPDQCRSHHQKMQKKYSSVDSILANSRKQLLKLKKRNRQQIQKASIYNLEFRNQNVLGCSLKSGSEEGELAMREENDFENSRLSNTKEPSQIGLCFRNHEVSLLDMYQQGFQFLF